MKKFSSRVMAAVLACLLCITMVMPANVPAASKKKVSIKTIKSGTTMSVGTAKSLNVKVNTKSSLSYKSSNSKIATVKKGKVDAKKPGSAKITVTASPKSKKFKKTSKSITVKVTPQKPSAPSVKRNGKAITASVKKVKYASGYQFQYSTNQKMSGAKSKSTKSASYKFNASTSKDYFVRVRAYTKTGGKTYYSSWSAVNIAPKTTASAKPTTPAKPTPSKPAPAPRPDKPTTCSHVWDTGKITKQPTCVAAGVKIYTCIKCKTTKTESIAATGQHSWNNGIVTKEPNCTQDGIKVYTCNVCKTTKTEMIPANGKHVWEVLGYDAPTCESPSFKSYYCPYCGETKCEYPEPATGHKWIEHPEEGHYETRVEYISAQVCNQCGKGYISRRLLDTHSVTETEVIAAGYEVADDASDAVAMHTMEMKWVSGEPFTGGPHWMNTEDNKTYGLRPDGSVEEIVWANSCENWSLKKVPVKTHSEEYKVDKPAYTECSVCGATK